MAARQGFRSHGIHISLALAAFGIGYTSYRLGPYNPKLPRKISDFSCLRNAKCIFCLFRAEETCLVAANVVLFLLNEIQCLVHTADTDKTRLSCLVLSCWHPRCELNWRLVKTVGGWKFRTSFVQSRNAVWTESCLVWDPVSNSHVVTYCDVIFGKTSSQMRSHRRRDWTELFSLQ